MEDKKYSGPRDFYIADQKIGSLAFSPNGSPLTWSEVEGAFEALRLGYENTDGDRIEEERRIIRRMWLLIPSGEYTEEKARRFAESPLTDRELMEMSGHPALDAERKVAK